ncbi:MAG: hypothetical protein ACKVQW_00110 [Pyrinomonadaceae bacterium]
MAQATVITQQEYWAGIRSGYATTREMFPRRETQEYENLLHGKVSYSRTQVSEYRSKDTYRTIETVVRDGKTTVTELIQIGIARYCREDTSEWKSCYEDPPPPLGEADETKYAVQVNQDSRTYIRTATLLRKEADRSEPTKFLTDDRLVLNMDMSVRERSIVKTVSETKSVVFRNTSKFEYNVALKPIEAPIK